MKESTSLNRLCEQVCAEKEHMISLRRDFHRHSEPSLQERRIAEVIEQELERFEISRTRIGVTGVLGILRGVQSGNGVVTSRVDIDALSIQETNDVEHRFQTNGIMHACGRDAHIASFLGAVEILSQSRDRFGGELRFLFQPTEETGEGAPDLTNVGALDGAECILGLHSAPDLSLGTIGLTLGLNSAVVGHFRTLVHGKTTHVSTPQLGVDALYAASQIAVAIQGLIAQRSSPAELVLLSIGKFAAKTTYNTVTEYAELEGTAHTTSQETCLQVRRRIDQTTEQIAAISDAEARVIWSDITSALISDPQVSHEAAKVAEGLGDHIQIVINRPLSLGGDNLVEYQHLISGCYACIDTASTDLPSTSNSPHNGNFNLDENTLALGAGLCVGYVLWWLGRQEKP